MVSGRRVAFGAIAVVLAACVPGALTVGLTDAGEGDGPAMGADGAQGDAGADQAASGKDGSGDQANPGNDSGLDVVSSSDASDAAPLPDGYIVCAMTSVDCNVAGGQECCLNVYGMTEPDGGSAFMMTIASCEMIGGPNCGAYIGTGSTFDEQLAQTCSTSADCTPMAKECCVPLDDGGNLQVGQTIGCTSLCGAPDKTICRNNGDCNNGTTCQPETDPILMHLYAMSCR